VSKETGQNTTTVEKYFDPANAESEGSLSQNCHLNENEPLQAGEGDEWAHNYKIQYPLRNQPKYRR
jgi:hypothetical protein